MRAIRGNERGQAMVECVVMLPALIILLLAIEIVAESYLIKHQTIVGSRYGTWRLAREQTSQKDIEESVAKYFFDAEQNRVTLKTTPVDSSFGDEVLDVVKNVFTDNKNDPLSASYEVEYDAGHNIPSPFRNTFSDGFVIVSNHLVDGNSWNGSNTEVHEGFGLLWNGIPTAGEYLFDGIKESFKKFL